MTRGQVVVGIVGAAAALLYFARGTASAGSFDATDSYGSNPTSRIRSFAEAIARAEGFYSPGTIPAQARNPGDLVIPNWTGAKLGSEGISVLASVDEGWRRLYKQLEIIVAGRSAIYTLSDTVASMGAKWAPKDGGVWAVNVANRLGVPVTTRLNVLLV